MESLTSESFKEKVFDYTEMKKDERIKSMGKNPVIVDFKAEWCLPCKSVAPILEELSKEYEGKLDIYKIDVDEEPELSSSFGIRNIPSVMFIPVNGVPRMKVGALPKSKFKEEISKVFNL